MDEKQVKRSFPVASKRKHLSQQISKIAMMPPKDCRPLLFSLSADAFVSLQEVPRGADRNPTRTFFLW
jgi:DNA-directed RNA polymerase III subunit RPC3